MNQERPLRTLPIEGVDLRELIVEGKGKRSTLMAIAIDGRTFRFGLSDHCLQIAVRGSVNTEIHALDDLTIRIRYSAEHLSLARAQVDYPGDDANWDGDVEKFARGKLMSWALSRICFDIVGESNSA